MPWATVQANTIIDPAFSAADSAAILAAMKTAYDGSANARAMFDPWVNAGKQIRVNFVAGAFQALLNTGIVEIDLAFLNGNNYITPTGRAVEDTLVTGLVHELGHALGNKRDNWNNVSDYKGDNVNYVNPMYTQLGLPEQLSYIAYDTNNGLVRNFDYTKGTAIDRAVFGYANWNSSAAGNSRDLLIGTAAANQLSGGDNNDWFWGLGGDDTLRGGGGRLDTIGLMGTPTEYDIRRNPDGTWTSRHVRGDADEGTDQITNIERVMFENGDIYNLAKKGLTFQTDFALVVDVTGSMGDDIAAVKAQGASIINALFNNNRTDARIGIVTFRDTTIGEPSAVVLPFTDQDQFADRKSAALTALNSLSVSGGGDFPETAFDGLLTALDGRMGQWRPGAGTHRIALFTDATAKDSALAGTVAAYAADIGAVISASAVEERAGGMVGTFSLDMSGTPLAMANRGPFDDDFPVPEFEFPEETPDPDSSTANLEIYVIYTGGFTSDSGLDSIAATTGGSTFVAAENDDIVDAILDIIEGPASLELTDIQVRRNAIDLIFNGAVHPTVLPTAGSFVIDVINSRGQVTGTRAISNITRPSDATISLGFGGNAFLPGSDVRIRYQDAEGDQDTGVIQDQRGRDFASFDRFGTTYVTDQAVARLAPEFANINLTGAAKILAVGNDKANIITGNQGNNDLRGRAGKDLIIGNAGDDIISGGKAGDSLYGDGSTFGAATAGDASPGRDTFRFVYGDSLFADMDRIHDLVIGQDRIDAPRQVNARFIQNLGAISSLDEAAVVAFLAGRRLESHGASIFVYNDSVEGDRTFLAINDRSVGFNAAIDNIVEITGYSGNITGLGIV